MSKKTFFLCKIKSHNVFVVVVVDACVYTMCATNTNEKSINARQAESMKFYVNRFIYFGLYCVHDTQMNEWGKQY